jgi:teichuronic acid biosynthesis glycosyltransferase TuaC
VRVLVLANDFPSREQPEAGIFVLRQLQALTKLGYDPFVVRLVARTPPFGDLRRLSRAIPSYDVVEGIPVRSLRAFFAPRMIGLEYLHLQLDSPIRKIVRYFNPAIVQAHFLLTSGHLAVQQPGPTVVTAHGADAYDWPLRRLGLRRAAQETIRRASRLVAVSDFIRDKVRSLADRQVDVIYNGADEQTFAAVDREGARAELDLASDAFVVAFAGQLIAAKGVFDLLRAVERLKRLRPSLLLAGPASNAIARVVASLHIDARVMGTLPHDKLARVFAACDVVALPSYYEGLPVVICEAMLAGRPVIASSVGGVPEIVADGERGLLVAPGDVESLERKLELLARDRALGEQMGRAGHEFARTHLTWSVNAAQYDSLYRQVATEFREGGLEAVQHRSLSAAR